MILHIYHCSLAIIEDYPSSPGRNRPAGTGRHPERAGEANVRLLPPTHGFGDTLLGDLLRLFQSIDIADTTNSPVKINWGYLQTQLGLSRQEVRRLMSKADALGLMRSLTIEYDYRVWLQRSSDKGCLVVMTCIEEPDLDRDPAEYAAAYCDTIDAVRSSVLNAHQTLQDVVVVPNGHLAPRSGDGLPWEAALDVLTRLPPALKRRGYQASLNSYGYSKVIQLAINAHKIGYVLRVV